MDAKWTVTSGRLRKARGQFSVHHQTVASASSRANFRRPKMPYSAPWKWTPRTMRPISCSRGSITRRTACRKRSRTWQPPRDCAGYPRRRDSSRTGRNAGPLLFRGATGEFRRAPAPERRVSGAEGGVGNRQDLPVGKRTTTSSRFSSSRVFTSSHNETVCRGLNSEAQPG